MLRSKASTVTEYLDELPGEQRAEVGAVRDVVLAHLPDGHAEGMITWFVPLEASGPTFDKQPLGYVALAAQKRHFSLYLTAVDGEGEESFRSRYAATGKELDMGKSWVRFKRASDLALDVIGEEIARLPVEAVLGRYRRHQPL